MTSQPSPEMNQTDGPALVRASELSQYSFCQRAWWLGAVKKLQPTAQERLTRGTQLHQRHAAGVRLALGWRYAGLALLGAGSFLLIITVVFSMF